MSANRKLFHFILFYVFFFFLHTCIFVDHCGKTIPQRILFQELQISFDFDFLYYYTFPFSFYFPISLFLIFLSQSVCMSSNSVCSIESSSKTYLNNKIQDAFYFLFQMSLYIFIRKSHRYYYVFCILQSIILVLVVTCVCVLCYTFANLFYFILLFGVVVVVVVIFIAPCVNSVVVADVVLVVTIRLFINDFLFFLLSGCIILYNLHLHSGIYLFRHNYSKRIPEMLI